LRAAAAEPLGVLPEPNELPGGCLAAGDRGFFCDYVLDYLARAGISKEQVARGGYLIRTTLEPKVQDSVKSAIDKIASPTLDGVASVMNVIKPGKDSHRVLAMASNRTYSLNSNAHQTVQPQPFSLVGDGAGSIFKIFTTTAALDMGYDLDKVLTCDDLVQGENAFFSATGVTDGDVLQGVRYQGDRGATTESLVMRSRSGTVRRIHARHDRAKMRAMGITTYG